MEEDSGMKMREFEDLMDQRPFLVNDVFVHRILEKGTKVISGRVSRTWCDSAGMEIRLE